MTFKEFWGLVGIISVMQYLFCLIWKGIALVRLNYEKSVVCNVKKCAGAKMDGSLNI